MANYMSGKKLTLTTLNEEELLILDAAIEKAEATLKWSLILAEGSRDTAEGWIKSKLPREYESLSHFAILALSEKGRPFPR
jgi:hypothetical protein